MCYTALETSVAKLRVGPSQTVEEKLILYGRAQRGYRRSSYCTEGLREGRGEAHTVRKVRRVEEKLILYGRAQRG